MSNENENLVVGYAANGREIYAKNEGFVTQAFIFCKKCNLPIKSTGGPSTGSICVSCLPKYMITLLDKKYDDESMYDGSRDFAEALDENFNSMLKHIPKDEHNFLKGTFRVLITWEPDDDS